MIILGNVHVGLLKVSNISRVRKRASLSLHIIECVSMLYATNMLFKNLFSLYLKLKDKGKVKAKKIE